MGGQRPVGERVGHAEVAGRVERRVDALGPSASVTSRRSSSASRSGPPERATSPTRSWAAWRPSDAVSAVATFSA